MNYQVWGKPPEAVQGNSAAALPTTALNTDPASNAHPRQQQQQQQQRPPQPHEDHSQATASLHHGLNNSINMVNSNFGGGYDLNKTILPYFPRSLNQFNEDVSSAVLALVQVKAQPQHEQVHHEVQQRISQITPKLLPLQNALLPLLSSPSATPNGLQQMHLDPHRHLIQHQRPQLPPTILAQSGTQPAQSAQQHQLLLLPQLAPPQLSLLPRDRNGKPLANSKRAEQNRVAQKLFRMRKEQYIKDLENQITQIPVLKETISALRLENLELKEFILSLQERLLRHEVQAKQGKEGE